MSCWKGVPELGGTWQVNSYPGAEVDVPTSLYCISFIPYPFRKSFARQGELLSYTNHIIDRFGLRKHARANQSVTRIAFDERQSLWNVETESGERYRSRFVIDTSGVLANPHVPGIRGAETFQGPMFHSGHWDHSVAYEGKRVGVIGSGCSAAQIVPAIADKVSRLTVFMGKAQWILPRSDRHYGDVERFVRTLPGIRHIIRLLVFAFYDIRFIAFRRYPGVSGISRLMKAHYRRRLQKHLDTYISDDRLRRHMMPDYELGCRRVIPTNTYLPALSRDNVDVDISGIACITPRGIRTKMARISPWMSSSMPPATSPIRHEAGADLPGPWAGGPQSQQRMGNGGGLLQGHHHFRLSQLLQGNGPNTGSGHSSQISYMEAATNYIVQAICAVKRNKSIKAIDARRELQDAYFANMRTKMQKTVWQNATCTAFYRKNMTDEVTSLSPEPVTGFILSRKWFRLGDYRLLK